MRSLFSGVGLVAVLIAGADHARACPAACVAAPVRTFPSGVFIPGNLVYFKVQVDNPGPLSLKTGDGKEIPASIRMIGPDRVFAPIDPIAAGTIALLTYPSNSCGASAENLTFVFQTSAPLEIQLQPASLGAGEYGLISAPPGFVSPPVDVLAFQRLSYGPLDAAGASFHLIDLNVTADGVVYVGTPNSIEIQGICNTDVPVAVGPCAQSILGSGRHVVRVQPHIVGLPDPPAVELEINFDRACGIGCSAAASPAAGAGGATSTVGGGTAAPVAGSPAKSVAGAAGQAAAGNAGTRYVDPGQPPAAPSGAGGCSATGRAGASDGRAMWLVAFALAGWRRRRGASAS